MAVTVSRDRLDRLARVLAGPAGGALLLAFGALYATVRAVLGFVADVGSGALAVGAAGVARALVISAALAVAVAVVSWVRRLVARRECTAFEIEPARGVAEADLRETALHEAGHRCVALALGGRVREVVIRPDGSGTTWVSGLPSAAAEVAVDRAGEYAARSSRGCSSDHALRRQHLKAEPWGSRRDRLAREGDALGRRTVRSERGRIDRYAGRLLKAGDGRLAG